MPHNTNILTGSDYISLPVRFTLTTNTLFDTALWARHWYQPAARPLLMNLKNPIAYKAWLNIAHEHSITPLEADNILYFLNDHFALSVQRPVMGQIRYYYKQMSYLVRGYGITHVGRSWRASKRNIIKATFYALLPVFVVTILTSALLYNADGEYGMLQQAFVMFSLSLWLSTIAHEMAHMYLMRRSNIPCCIVQRGLRVGVLHASMTYRHELVSAISGPVAGMLTAIMLGAAGSFVCQNGQLLLIGLALVVFHCLSLLPLYGDGKVICKARRAAI